MKLGSRVWLVGVFLLIFNLTARAEEISGTSVVVESPSKNGNAVPDAEKIDDMIENNRLRAISGSKSRWSIASQFNYNGGSLLDPLSQDRPNIAAASATTTKSDLDGAISVKYNIDSSNSVMAGVGMRWIAPLSGGVVNNYKGKVFDVMNPYITYQHLYKWYGIQSVLQVQGLQWTQADQTAVGYSRQLYVIQENMLSIARTGLSAGAAVWGQYQWFNKTGSYGTPGTETYIPDIASVQSTYSFGIVPVLEYQVTEKVNLRTLVSLWTYEHYADYSSPWKFFHDTVYQSVGVGISFTRNIFAYPNIQFLPGQLMASKTNVGINATVNLF